MQKFAFRLITVLLICNGNTRRIFLRDVVGRSTNVPSKLRKTFQTKKVIHLKIIYFGLFSKAFL